MTTMTFTEPMWADQHLNQDGERVTLCGWLFEDLTVRSIYDHRDGFDIKKGDACQECADRADRIQNG